MLLMLTTLTIRRMVATTGTATSATLESSPSPTQATLVAHMNDRAAENAVSRKQGLVEENH
jgi:hypothetical protein